MVRYKLLHKTEVDVAHGVVFAAFHSSFLCKRAFFSEVLKPQFQISPLVGSQVKDFKAFGPVIKWSECQWLLRVHTRV